METTAEGVYAIGDLVGGLLLAHVASREGIVAASRAAGKDIAMDYRAVPRCTFTHPEVAGVGLTEAAALAQGIDVRTGRFPFAALGKAAAEGEPQGFVKVVCEAGSGVVVGGVIVGRGASDLIHEIALAVHARLPVHEIANAVHAHPSLAEAVMEAAEAVDGLSIHSLWRPFRRARAARKNAGHGARRSSLGSEGRTALPSPRTRSVGSARPSSGSPRASRTRP